MDISSEKQRLEDNWLPVATLSGRGAARARLPALQVGQVAFQGLQQAAGGLHTNALNLDRVLGRVTEE